MYQDYRNRGERWGSTLKMSDSSGFIAKEQSEGNNGVGDY